MGGTVSTSVNWVPDNRYDRINIPNDHYRVALSIPSGSYATGCVLRLIDFDPYMANSERQQYADLLTPSSWWLDGGYLKWRDGRAFRGDGAGGSVQAMNSNGTVKQNWPGGVGGYVSYAWSAPGAGTVGVSRDASGTSLTVTCSGGSGVISGRRVTKNSGASWEGHSSGTGSYTYSVGAHETVSGIYGNVYNDDNSTSTGPYTSYGIPKAPVNVSISKSSTVAGRITGSWSAPDYVGHSLNKYVVKRKDTVTNEVVTIIDSNTTSFTDNNLVRGRAYDYEIYIVGNSSPGNGLSATVTGVIAPGIPSQPDPYSIEAPLILSKTGRNVTVSCQASLNDYGNAITKYYVDYTIDGTTWSTKQEMTNRSFTYSLLPPAKTYQFRCYAYNSIGYGDQTLSIPLFVPAGGKRLRSANEDLPGTYQPTNVAKRYDASLIPPRWVDVNIAKRFVQSENNGLGAWVELT